jgi:hypothetical protein
MLNYEIKVVSNLRQVGAFLRVLRFPPHTVFVVIKLTNLHLPKSYHSHVPGSVEVMPPKHVEGGGSSVFIS